MISQVPKLALELEMQMKAVVQQLDSARCTEQLDNCLSEFDMRFQNFCLMDQIAILHLYACAILLWTMPSLNYWHQKLQYCFT